jgi:hypothetical protein
MSYSYLLVIIIIIIIAHNRNTPKSLGECFECNAKGMLKNIAIHELALFVSFYDITVKNIESVSADREFSSMQTLTGPSGKEFTDFDGIKFTIKTKTGRCFIGVSSQHLFMGRRQARRCVFARSEIGCFKNKAQKMGSLQHHVKAIMFKMKSLSVSL